MATVSEIILNEMDNAEKSSEKVNTSPLKPNDPLQPKETTPEKRTNTPVKIDAKEINVSPPKVGTDKQSEPQPESPKKELKVTTPTAASPDKTNESHIEFNATSDEDASQDSILNKNKELKSILQLSKEANLDTNIGRKRKSIDPTQKKNESEEKEAPRKSNVKKSKLDLSEINVLSTNQDAFCWRCHKPEINISCGSCPRSYHSKCIKVVTNTPWQCPECMQILKSESTSTRSGSTKDIKLEDLCTLLKIAHKHMMEVPESEPFHHPVKESEFPEYKQFIVQPMDLTKLKKNIQNKMYGSTIAFEADTMWILHNSIIFNSYQSKLTSVAKSIMKICKQEMYEIETCSNCYLNANTKDDWFVEVCPKPHILLWAKLKGFPYWPAKAMCVNNVGMVDVRFFGAHDRAWVSHRDCYLYCQKNPNANQMKKNDINECIKEVNVYIEKLKKAYGTFKFAPYKLAFDADTDYLPLYLPNYVPLDKNGSKLIVIKRSGNKSSSTSPTKSASANTDDKIKDEDDSEGELNIAEGHHVTGDQELVFSSPETTKEENKKTVEEEAKTIEVKDKNEKTKLEENNKKPEENKLEPIIEKTLSDNKNEAKEDEKGNKLINCSSKLKISDQLFKKLSDTNNTNEISIKETDKKEEKKVDSENDSDVPSVPPPTSNKNTNSGDYEENDLLEVMYTEPIECGKTATPDLIASKAKQKTEEPIKKGTEVPEVIISTSNVSGELENLLNKSSIKMNIEPRKDLLSTKVNDSINTLKPIKPKEPEVIVKLRNVEDMKKPVSSKIPIEENKRFTQRRNKPAKTKEDFIYDKDMNQTIEKVIQTSVIETNSDKKVTPISNKKRKINNAESKENESNKKVIRVLNVESLGDQNFLAAQKSQHANEKSSPEIQEIKSEPVSEEEDDSDSYQTAKRMYLSALNIADKVTEEIVKKPHEIQTRSKVEEKINNNNNNKIVNHLSLITDKIAALKEAEKRKLNATKERVKAKKSFPSSIHKINNLDVNKSSNSNTSSSTSLETDTSSTISSASTVIQNSLQVGGNTTAIISTETRVPIQQVPLEITIPDTIAAMQTETINLVNTSGTTINGEVDSLQQSQQPADFNIYNGITNEYITKVVTDVMCKPPPKLKPRPPGPFSTTFEEPLPSSTGPMTAQINSLSHRLSDYFRGLLVETLGDISKLNNPEAIIANLRLENETLKHKHKNEIMEIKKTVNSLLQDIQKSIIEEKEKIVQETRAQCEAETLKRVEEAKMKQWCANCMKEALFYCCWNTSYCDYPCQTKHWPKHMSKCTQASQPPQARSNLAGKQPIILRQTVPPKGLIGKPIVGKTTKLIVSNSGSKINIVRNTANGQLTLVEPTPGNFYELLGNGQISNKIVANPTVLNSLLQSQLQNTQSTPQKQTKTQEASTSTSTSTSTS